MPRRARVLLAGLATMFLLLLSATAFSAPNGLYRGKTSQGEPISLTVSDKAVSELRFTIDERCPDGHILADDESGFGSLVVAKGKFGGEFVPSVNRQPGELTVVAGRVGTRRVSGSISVSTRSSHRGKPLCHGSMTFSLRRS